MQAIFFACVVARRTAYAWEKGKPGPLAVF